MSKPNGGHASLFAFLFPPKPRTQLNERYQQALERALAKDHEQQAKKPESEEQKEGEPKCWVN